MSPEYFDQWTKFTRGALDAVKSLSELNIKAFERAAVQQLELVQATVDISGKSAQLLNDSRSYKDLVTGQAGLANEYSDRVIEIVRKGNQLATELRDEYAAWTEGRVREVVTPLGKTGPAAGKKAA